MLTSRPKLDIMSPSLSVNVDRNTQSSAETSRNRPVARKWMSLEILNQHAACVVKQISPTLPVSSNSVDTDFNKQTNVTEFKSDSCNASNCWEKNGELFVDVLELDAQQGEQGNAQYRDIFHQPFPATGRMQRYRFNMMTGKVQAEDLPNNLPCEFPQWDWRAQHPRLAGWFGRISGRASVAETMPS